MQAEGKADITDFLMQLKQKKEEAKRLKDLEEMSDGEKKKQEK